MRNDIPIIPNHLNENGTHSASHRKSAFTLAEVLITLGIIGVVAAMTLPSLIQNYKIKQTVSQLKSTYSILSQAFKLAEVENGEAEYWDIGGPDTQDGAIKLYNILKPFLIKIEDCTGTKGCFYNGTYKNMQGTDLRVQPGTWSVYARGRLNNGVSIATWSSGTGCNGDYSKSNSGSLYRGCGQICVDINGDKKPNQAGMDYFCYVITKDGIIPSGTSDFAFAFVPGDLICQFGISAGGNGTACTAWLMYNENMDYLTKPISWDE